MRFIIFEYLKHENEEYFPYRKRQNVDYRPDN